MRSDLSKSPSWSPDCVFQLNTTGLAPSTTLDKARADMIVDADMDIIQKMAQWHFEKDEAKKVTFKGGVSRLRAC